MYKPAVKETSPYLATFPVDEVVPAEDLIYCEPLREHVAKRYRRKVFLLPDSAKLVTNRSLGWALSRNLPADTLRNMKLHAVDRCHPLIEAVGIAFSDHRGLTLSPDAIWLVIAQGFSHHVAENTEDLRASLVRHEGKVKLTADIRALNLQEFQSAIATFSSKIREHTNPVLHETLLCDFSTTTPPIRTASEVTLMDSYSGYFEFSLTCTCGIPRMNLEGTLEDWQRIRARVEVLTAFGLEWWVERLRPILDEFVRSAEGYADKKFWQAIYKPRQAYADRVVTGWIADLFPYLGDAPRRTRNHVFREPREDWSIAVKSGVASKVDMAGLPLAKGVSEKSFPSGLASVPVDLQIKGGPRTTLGLIAGFLAVEQNVNDLSLSPVIGWGAAELVSPQSPMDPFFQSAASPRA